MRPRGFSLVELMLVVAILVIAAAVSLPVFRSYTAEAHLVGAGQAFRSQFRRARSIAVRRNAYTAIRFETAPDGDVYSIYGDGNGNGVRSAEIRAGIDYRIEGPFPLTGGAPSVRVGFLPGVPAVPPAGGTLSGDPVRFGRSNMLSFSPLGTATPGTFYLAGDGVQAAVRVTPGSARVRLMIWRGDPWRVR